MNIITRVICWITPTGWTLRKLQYYRNDVRASGVLTLGRLEIQIHKLLPTCYDGIFLAYSVDEHNKKINNSIDFYKYRIEQLEKSLK